MSQSMADQASQTGTGAPSGCWGGLQLTRAGGVVSQLVLTNVSRSETWLNATEMTQSSVVRDGYVFGITATAAHAARRIVGNETVLSSAFLNETGLTGLDAFVNYTWMRPRATVLAKSSGATLPTARFARLWQTARTGSLSPWLPPRQTRATQRPGLFPGIVVLRLSVIAQQTLRQQWFTGSTAPACHQTHACCHL